MEKTAVLRHASLVVGTRWTCLSLVGEGSVVLPCTPLRRSVRALPCASARKRSLPRACCRRLRARSRSPGRSLQRVLLSMLFCRQPELIPDFG